MLSLPDTPVRVDAEFGIYIHWPFCSAKCPYCDFNSHVSRNIDHDAWAVAYEKELDRWADLTEGRLVSTVFFGGGTPSLMEPSVVGRVLDRIQRRWPMVNNPEITLEANPTSSESQRFLGFHAAGVNRLSLGVQALNDPDLRALGRMHSAAEAQTAFDIARSVFDRVSFDLIYARQKQTQREWEKELLNALDMAADHLSLYQLTIEPETAFGDRFAAGKLRDLPNDDLSADMYALTQAMCDAHGFPAYEISNHARSGSESRHNLIYWTNGDWLGIGPGAHGRVTLDGRRFGTETVKSPSAWLEGTCEPDKLYAPLDEISLEDQAVEYLLMGLRLREGCDLLRLGRLSFEPSSEAIGNLVELDLLDVSENRLRVKPAGRLVLNEILRQLLV